MKSDDEGYIYLETDEITSLHNIIIQNENIFVLVVLAILGYFGYKKFYVVDIEDPEERDESKQENSKDIGDDWKVKY